MQVEGDYVLCSAMKVKMLRTSCEESKRLKRQAACKTCDCKPPSIDVNVGLALDPSKPGLGITRLPKVTSQGWLSNLKSTRALQKQQEQAASKGQEQAAA